MTEFKTAWFVHVIFDMLFNVLFKLSPLPQMAVLRFEHLSEDVCLLSSTFKCCSIKSPVNIGISSHQESVTMATSLCHLGPSKWVKWRHFTLRW